MERTIDTTTQQQLSNKKQQQNKKKNIKPKSETHENKPPVDGKNSANPKQKQPASLHFWRTPNKIRILHILCIVLTN